MSFYDDPTQVAAYIEMTEECDASELIEILRQHVPARASLLELGSGPGNDATMLAAHYKLTVSDYSPVFLSHLRKRFPLLTVLDLDCRNLQLQPSCFDAIYSNKVLHHLSDEELQSSLKQQLGTLRPHGLLFHSFWKGRKKERSHGLLFNFHSPKSFGMLIADICSLYVYREYKEMEENDSFLAVMGTFG